MRDFRELTVWQKAHQLTLDVYAETTKFPPDERFGLTTQLRRAAVSIATNIVHGAGKSERHEFVRHLQLAHGLGSELEYLLLLARDLEALNVTRYEKLQAALLEVKKMITGLAKRVTSQLPNADLTT